MNEPIRYLIVGAAIGIAGAVAGAVVMAWATGKAETHARAYRSQPASPFTSSKFNPATSRLNGVTNAVARPLSSFAPAFQKMQGTPEVKKAKEEYLAAQKKYVAAMQATMGAQKPAVAGQGAAQK
jgi:hypothetical protein